MAKFEDLVTQVRDAGLEDLADELNDFSATSLRRTAEQARTFEERATKAEAELAGLKSLPRKHAALEAVGVNLSQLRPADRKVIAESKLSDDQITESWAEQFAKEMELPTTPREPSNEGEESGAERVVQAAMSAPSTGTSGTVPIITAEDFAAWPMDKRMRFLDAHPVEFDALLRGQEVNLVFT